MGSIRREENLNGRVLSYESEILLGENICREGGFKSLATSTDDSDLCAVCLERACSVAAEGSFFYPY